MLHNPTDNPTSCRKRRIDRSNSQNSILVLGYGNLLRSDDGVGQRVAEVVAAQDRPAVKSLAVQQLTPELAAILATVDLAFFIDAYAATGAGEVQVQALTPAPALITLGHTGEPRSLLALTESLYGSAPQSWWITIPGVNFDVGDCLSPVATQGIKIALQKLDQLIQTTRTRSCTKWG